jgi:glyoxylase-like metal-dependent hydrolase (beta-lactamase superfamily II)
VRFRHFAVFILLLLPLAGQTANHPLHELAPGVYEWQGDRDQREPANATWIVFKDYVFLVDANFPWGAREIVPAIRKTTDKPIRYVFNTHYHGDHSFGNSIYSDLGATIICTEACANEMKTKGAASWANWNNPQHSLEGAHLQPPAITFSDRLVFDDGTQRVELIRLGPGHSKGDGVAYLPNQKIVATGDLCVTWGFGNNVGDADGDYDNWLRVLDEMASWEPKVVVPGHGPISDRSALLADRDYLADMMKQVKAGMQAGETADQLATEINLSSHGTIAGDATANATSVRAMYKRFSAK